MKAVSRVLYLVIFSTLFPLMPVFAQSVTENDSSAAAAKKNRSLPLIATRTLSFDTSEGTWISLDVSPDGSTIVFELLGDLYTLPIEGGEATRITDGQAYDMQPRYSPDGSQIVFVSDRDGSENIWVANADGTGERAVTKTEWKNYVSPTWTPDGRWILATRNSELVIFHTDLDTGTGIELTGKTGTTSGGYYGAAFGPDESHIWVNVTGTPSSGFAVGVESEALIPEHDRHDELHGIRSSLRQEGSWQIGQFDRESGRVFIRTHEHTGAFRPVPSPDGKWVVYATRFDDREALKLLDVETGMDGWLLMDVQRDASQGGGTNDRDVYPGSAFTPDSKALITAFAGKIWRVEVPSGEWTEIPFVAHVEQELGPLAKFDYPINDSLLIVSQIRGSRPSPDGTQIVFTALDKLWIANLQPGAGDNAATDSTHSILRSARRLTASADVEHAPAWSPDGRWIAYVTWNDSTGGDIWRVRPTGNRAPERLSVQHAFFDRLAYTADGTRIMAVRGSMMHRMRFLEDFGSHSGTSELEYIWMPADGGEHHRIHWIGSGATEEGRNGPHVGPDPNRMYVYAGSDGLISMRFDGSDIKTHFKVTGPSHPVATGDAPSAEEVILSPDGTRAIVAVNRNVFLISIPPVGGDPVTLSVTSSSIVPNVRLTDIGGDFVGWNSDGSTAHYSIGRSYFEWNVAEADSAFKADLIERRLKSLEEDGEGTEADSTDAAGSVSLSASADSLALDSGDQKEEEVDDEKVYEATRYDLEIVVPKDKPKGAVALTGARIITMNGDEVIEHGDILVRDNRIAAVGPSGTVSIPPDADRIDMSGKTIYPGLVDIHAHTWISWGVHRNQVSQFLAQLAYGVTTQRDPQTSTEDVVTYSDRMEIGDFIGPRSYSTGPGIFSADNIKSLKEARNVLKRYSEHFNTKTIKQYMAGDRKIRQWVIMAANELGLTPTTEGGSNFTMNLTLMQDGYAGLEHSLPISPFFGDVVELGAFSGLVYTPTFIVAYGGPSGRQYYLTHTDLDAMTKLRRFTPHDELDKWKQTTWYRDDQYVHRLHAVQLAKWVEGGGRVGLGSHGEVQGIGTHWELWMMAEGGLSNHDALRAATIHSADAIGLDNDLGSVETGKLADLQVLNSNPMDDLHNTTDIAYVMKNGRLYHADTLDEVWPRQRPLPTQWWWRIEPPTSMLDSSR